MTVVALVFAPTFRDAEARPTDTLPTGAPGSAPSMRPADDEVGAAPTAAEAPQVAALLKQVEAARAERQNLVDQIAGLENAIGKLGQAADTTNHELSDLSATLELQLGKTQNQVRSLEQAVNQSLADARREEAEHAGQLRAELTEQAAQLRRESSEQGTTLRRELDARTGTLKTSLDALRTDHQGLEQAVALRMENLKTELGRVERAKQTAEVQAIRGELEALRNAQSTSSKLSEQLERIEKLLNEQHQGGASGGANDNF